MGNISSSWFNPEMYSKVIKAGAIGQNTYDFLLAFYTSFGYILYSFCGAVDSMPT